MIEPTLADGYARFLGLKMLELEEDRNVLLLPFREQLTNNGSILHGGLAPSLACIGARSLVPGAASGDEASVHMASLHVSYVGAGVEQDVRCETRLVRPTSSINFVESVILGEDGTRIANTQATVRYRHAREAGQVVVDRLDESSEASTPLPVPSSAPFLHHLGFVIEESTEGRSRLRLGYREELADKTDFHEAALLALFDVAGAMSSHAAYGPADRPIRVATIAMQALGLTPSLGAEEVLAVSRCVRRDGDFFWNDIRIAVARTREVLVRGGLVYRIAAARERGGQHT